MFIRWKRRALKKANSYDPNPLQLTAYLVESRRVDGKPRQRTVAYLGSVRERDMDGYWQRRDFWQTATRKLDALNLPQPERQRIETRLQDVVPMPTPNEEATAAAARATELARLESVIAAGMRRTQTKGR